MRLFSILLIIFTLLFDNPRPYLWSCVLHAMHPTYQAYSTETVRFEAPISESRNHEPLPVSWIWQLPSHREIMYWASQLINMAGFPYLHIHSRYFCSSNWHTRGRQTNQKRLYPNPTDGQSFSPSWRPASCGTYDRPYFLNV